MIKKNLITLALLVCATAHANQLPFGYRGNADTYTIPINTICTTKDRHGLCTDACKSKGFVKGICKISNPNVTFPTGRCYCRYY